ncbi:MAG: HD-GYP domain-containing protein, partial [Acidimicrobiales bacterium]
PPDGLAGEQIPRSGRLLAVVDVYDALTHARPYRSAIFSPARARADLGDHAGTQFDPTCLNSPSHAGAARASDRAPPVFHCTGTPGCARPKAPPGSPARGVHHLGSRPRRVGRRDPFCSNGTSVENFFHFPLQFRREHAVNSGADPRVVLRRVDDVPSHVRAR